MADFTLSQNYTSEDHPRLCVPSLRFYMQLFLIMYRAGKVARAGNYSGDRWIYDSICVAKAIEHVGAMLHIDGIENLDFAGPCVFESNHMSTLETMLLPGIIQPRKDTTFVVKDSLLRYPCLGPVLQAREPIALARVNPREDLKLVLGKGTEILSSGRSIIIFTQGTRKTEVNTHDFNSLAVKLAKKAGVPIVPVALKTDVWSGGALFKDFGKIDPGIPVHFAIGKPVAIESASGKEEHEAIVRFIKDHYDAWNDA